MRHGFVQRVAHGAYGFPWLAVRVCESGLWTPVDKLLPMPSLL
jgi:hypothetical protein